MTSNQTPSEKSITNSIQKMLHGVPGVWCVKFHGGPYTQAGVPDILGAFYGRAFAIEVKRPGQKPTAIQDLTMARMRKAGIIVAVCHSVEEAQEMLYKMEHPI